MTCVKAVIANDGCCAVTLTVGHVDDLDINVAEIYALPDVSMVALVLQRDDSLTALRTSLHKQHPNAIRHVLFREAARRNDVIKRLS